MGFGLLSGSSITDITAALTTFCTQYGPNNWSALLRQELPGLTDAGIMWLCSLPEEMEQFEPQPPSGLISLVEVDRQETTIETRSKRGRRGTTIDDQGASGILLKTMEPHATDQSARRGINANIRRSVHPFPL